MKLIPGLRPSFNPIELCREAREPSSDCPRLPSYRAPLLSFMKGHYVFQGGSRGTKGGLLGNGYVGMYRCAYFAATPNQGVRLVGL